MSPTYEFALLGALEVRVHGREISVTAARQRVVLAVLLLNAGQAVSVERLAEAVWDEDLPRRPGNQIAICVSALRRTLSSAGAASDLVITRAPGYLIKADSDRLDIRRVETLRDAAQRFAAAGDLATAALEMRKALRFWRGPVLAGMTSRVLQPEVARWEEMRLSILEECVELELQLGRDHELIGEVSAVVAANPLRERPRRQLMLILYRAGRQADALALYQETRRLLNQELGLEPGQDLRGLNDAILTGTLNPGPPRPAATAPSLSRATAEAPITDTIQAEWDGLSPAGIRHSTSAGAERKFSDVSRLPFPRMLPHPCAHFTGRASELDAICQILTTELGGGRQPVRIAAVSGPGGIGKTSLPVAVAHRLQDRFPDGQIYVNLNGAERRPLEPLEVLAVFLRELGVDDIAMPGDVEQRAAIYRSILADRRTLVLLDNAADEVQVQPLLPGSGSSAVMLTSRSRLTGLDGVQAIELGLLPNQEVIELVRRLIGDKRVDDEPEAVAELVRCCGGLPLPVRIVGARLAARAHQRLGNFVQRLADESRRLDELAHGSLEVRTSIALSYRSLGVRAKRLFRRLGLVDALDFSAWIGAPLMDTHAAEAEDLFELLVDAQLLEVAGNDESGQLRYRFHDLVRLYARERAESEETPADRLAALTRMLGAWLALVEYAHVRLLGGNYAVVHGSAKRWLLAPDFYERLITDGAVWYESERRGIVAAVQQAANIGLDEYCWDLAVSAVSLFGTRSHYDEWRSTHGVALLAVRDAGNARGEAAILTGLGDLCVTQHRYEEAAGHLDRALEIFSELDDRHGYAVALRKAGYADSIKGDLDRALSRYGQALELLREVGDRGAELHIVRWIGQLHLELGRLDLAEYYLERAVTMSAGSRRSYAQARYRIGELALARGQLAQAEAMFTEALAIVEKIRDRRGKAYAWHGLGLGLVHLRRGRRRKAKELLTRALAEAVDIGDRLIEIPALIALAEYECAMRNPGDALRRLREAAAGCRQIQATLWLRRCHEAMDGGLIHTGRECPLAGADPWVA